MNLREFAAIQGFETAVLTTFEFDPVFFERVVLRDLIQSGVRQVIVLVDGPQSANSIEAAHDQLVDLGRRYQLYQVWTKGAFHAKLAIKLSAKSAIVACGSANLTYSGWLGVRSKESSAGNREVAGIWQVGPNTPQAADLKQALGNLAGCIGDVARTALERATSHAWLNSDSSQPERKLFVTSPQQPLAQQLSERWADRRFQRMWMATGSTDQCGAMLAWANEQFGIQQAVVELDPDAAIFDSALCAAGQTLARDQGASTAATAKAPSQARGL